MKIIWREEDNLCGSTPPPKNVGRLISKYINPDKSTVFFALTYYLQKLYSPITE